MKIILKSKIKNLGNIGDIVEVKDVPTVGQFTVNVRGDDIEVEASHVMANDIDDILDL